MIFPLLLLLVLDIRFMVTYVLGYVNILQHFIELYSVTYDKEIRERRPTALAVGLLSLF